jgi:hypothetical protein
MEEPMGGSLLPAVTPQPMNTDRASTPDRPTTNRKVLAKLKISTAPSYSTVYRTFNSKLVIMRWVYDPSGSRYRVYVEICQSVHIQIQAIKTTEDGENFVPGADSFREAGLQANLNSFYPMQACD